MVNRVIQQKIIKQRRMKRAWAKPLSRKGRTIDPNAGYVNLTTDKDGNPTREFVSLSISSRAKATKLVLDEYLLNRFRFHPASNEAIYARYGGLHTDLTPDKEIVLSRRVQSRSGAGTLQGEEKFVRKIYIDNPVRNLSLYMSGDTNFFVDLRVKSEGTYILKSVEYPDRHVAHQAYMSEIRGTGSGILWEEVTPPKADKKNEG